MEGVDENRTNLFREHGFDHFDEWFPKLFAHNLTPDAKLIDLSKDRKGEALLKVS